MLKVFEVHLAHGHDGSDILSDEIREETLAQLMTGQEAAAIGFSGFESADSSLRLIAVAPKDAGWIEKALERSPSVAGYRVHDVDA